ncbi:hypothetical protein [Alicyclobacillus sacchari]|nr:hypothetical protein [Alicyclobacillus sacchari]
MEPAVRTELERYFASDIAALEDVLGRDLSIWRKRKQQASGQ